MQVGPRGTHTQLFFARLGFENGLKKEGDPPGGNFHTWPGPSVSP
jgi:hypothetical protein